MKCLAIVTILSITAVAFADTNNGPPPPPDQGSSTGSGSAEEAPAEKTEQAKAIANAAALHPITPNPASAKLPAYLLYAEIDPPIIATGLVFMLGRTVQVHALSCGAPDPTDPI